jgi:hypothetical protein
MKRKLLTEVDREMVIAQIKRLDLSKTYTVDIIERRVRRTISQNSLYWLWLTCIELETGNNRQDLHEYFKGRYLLPEVKEVFGSKIEVRTTTDLDTAKFKTLLDQVQIFASTELAIALPDPDDLRWEEFYSYYSDKL